MRDGRRIVSVWLPFLSTDRVALHGASGETAPPCVLVASERGALRLVAVDPAAQRLGLAPGVALADARALIGAAAGRLAVMPADPPADAACLDRLARWCTRYTPWAAIEGVDGLWLDITGCAHLAGGERRLIDDLTARLGRLGFAARAAVADTPGAAWALARFAAGDPVCPPDAQREALAPLPPAALRLPGAAVETFDRLGVRRIADLLALPHQGLAARFGDHVVVRLDQALGLVAEPISPREPTAPYRARLALAEPVVTADDVARVSDRLLAELMARLAASELGARRLRLAFYRLDGARAEAEIATSRPTRDMRALARLFAPRLEAIDPGFGIEAATLDAAVVEPLAPAQLAFAPSARAAALEHEPASDVAALAPLIDRLVNRLGSDAVVRLAPRESHLPEQAVARVSMVDALSGQASAGTSPARWTHPDRSARPLRLLARPEPIDAVAPVPDDPPLFFRWRGAFHRIARADGPERLSPEWWRLHARLAERPAALGGKRTTRDYYRVEDTDGRRFWIYRNGPFRPDEPPPGWYLHGVFA
jgi:protein ImuB